MAKRLKELPKEFPPELAEDLRKFFDQFKNKAMVKAYQKRNWTLDGNSLGDLFTLMVISINSRGRWTARDDELLEKIFRGLNNKPSFKPKR